MSTSVALQQRSGSGTLPPQPAQVVVPYNFVGPLAPGQVRAPAPSANSQPQPKPVSPIQQPSPIPPSPWGGKVTVPEGQRIVPGSTQTVTVPLTREQRQERLIALTTVNAYPSSKEEAIAAGRDSYISPENKQAYRQEIMKAYPNKGVNAVSYQTEPNTKSLESAKAEQQQFNNQRPTIGTSAPQLSFNEIMLRNEQIKSGLSPTDKIAFEQWRSEQVITPTKNLALFLGAGIAAPLLGPVGAVSAVGLGVGVSQVMKTGATIIGGGDVGKSLLTPQEAYEAATGGLIFSGVGKGVYAGVTMAGGGKILTGFGVGATKTVTGVIGRAGVNAGLGAGGGTLYEYASTGKVTGKGAIQGAEFGAAFGLASEVVSAINLEYDVTGKIIKRAENYVTGKEIIRLQTEMDLYSHEMYNQGEITDLASVAGEHLSLQPSIRQQFISTVFGVQPRALSSGMVDMPDVLRNEFGNADLSIAEANRIAVSSRGKSAPELIAPDVAKQEFLEGLKSFDLSSEVVDVMHVGGKGFSESGELVDLIKMPKEMEGFSSINQYKEYLIAKSKVEGTINAQNLSTLTDSFVNEKTSFDYSNLFPKEIVEATAVARATSPTSKTVTEPYIKEETSFNFKGLQPDEVKLARNMIDAKVEPAIAPNLKHIQFENEAFEFSMQPKSSVLSSSKALGQYLKPPNLQLRNIFVGSVVGGAMKPLGGSKGSKPSEEASSPSPHIEQVTIQQNKANVISGSIPQGTFTVESQVTRNINPFQTFKGAPYYVQRNVAEETDQQFLTMPGQVQRLTSPTLTSMPQLNMVTTVFDTKQANKKSDVLTGPELSSALDVPQLQKQQPQIIQIQDQPTIQIQDQPTILIEDQPIIPIPGQDKIPQTFLPQLPGFEFGLGGQDIFGLQKKTGLRSRKRTYPTLTAKEFLGVDIKQPRKNKRFGDL